MQSYQLTLLIKEKLDEKARTGLIDDVKKNFSNLIKEDLWGIRSLAYEIKHADKAYYANFEFESEPQAVITLDKNIRLNEDIIRYLLVKKKIIKIRKTAKKKDEIEAKTEKVEAVAESEKPAEVEVKKVKRVVKKA